MVYEAADAGGADCVGDLPVVEEQEGVVECSVDVLDLAVGGVCPLLGLGALGLDACLLGYQDFFIDAFFEVELNELLLFGDQFAQPGLPLDSALSVLIAAEARCRACLGRPGRRFKDPLARTFASNISMRTLTVLGRPMRVLLRSLKSVCIRLPQQGRVRRTCFCAWSSQQLHPHLPVLRDFTRQIVYT